MLFVLSYILATYGIYLILPVDLLNGAWGLALYGDLVPLSQQPFCGSLNICSE